MTYMIKNIYNFPSEDFVKEFVKKFGFHDLHDEQFVLLSSNYSDYEFMNDYIEDVSKLFHPLKIVRYWETKKIRDILIVLRSILHLYGKTLYRCKKHNFDYIRIGDFYIPKMSIYNAPITLEFGSGSGMIY